MRNYACFLTSQQSKCKLCFCYMGKQNARHSTLRLAEMTQNPLKSVAFQR